MKTLKRKDQTKSVLTMVREHLECNGFDGLFNISPIKESDQ